METIIETRNLYKHYTLGKETINVLENISFTVQKNEYIAIMGQSGAGKSTLLNIIGCLDIPSTGEYLIREKSVATLSAGELADIRNKEIGFVFQNFNLLPKLDVAANVELPLIYANLGNKQRREMVERVLTRFGLWDRRKHKPNEISGGQKQRVAIARALVKGPAIILADEPTGNLDSHTTKEIMSVFDELHQEGQTIIIITHEHEVADHAARVIRLADGKVVA